MVSPAPLCVHDLRDAVRGDVRGDSVSRALYATDASIYQIEPLAVVAPLDEADVAATIQVARHCLMVCNEPK